MNAISTKEYDAFGPWIYEIDDEYTMPPLFMTYYNEKESPLMLIKIPRKINRADATPDMNLYDYVIGAFDSYLYIMKRVDAIVEERRVPYDSVVAIKNAVFLLKGQMLLYLGDEIVTIDYNTVSEPIIMKLVNIIRERYRTEEKELDIETISHDLNTVEHLYSAIIDHNKALDKKIRLVAYQPLSKFVPYYKHFRERIKALLKTNKEITSTAFITNDKELIVLQRDKRTRSRKQGDLTHSLLFLPFASIEKISKTKGTEDSKLNSMSISIKNDAFSFFYTDNNLQISELICALEI
jgi:hypothetical protein